LLVVHENEKNVVGRNIYFQQNWNFLIQQMVSAVSANFPRFKVKNSSSVPLYQKSFYSGIRTLRD